jgi:hypothetical protein
LPLLDGQSNRYRQGNRFHPRYESRLALQR